MEFPFIRFSHTEVAGFEGETQKPLTPRVRADGYDRGTLCAPTPARIPVT